MCFASYSPFVAMAYHIQILVKNFFLHGRACYVEGASNASATGGHDKTVSLLRGEETEVGWPTADPPLRKNETTQRHDDERRSCRIAKENQQVATLCA